MHDHHTLRFTSLRAGFYPTSKYWWMSVFNPIKYYKFVKHFIQRGYRGYADCDYGDVDGYLESVMSHLFTDLKNHTHGYPTDLTPEKWKSILEEIIEGLDASDEIKIESTVPDEVYPLHKYPINFKDVGNGFFELECNSDEPSFVPKEYDKWKAPLELKKRRAFRLIRRYWPNFWD